MRKFSIEFRVYALGSVYRGQKTVEAANVEAAKKILMDSDKNILSCEEIVEVL